MNDIRGGRVTCYLDDIRPLRSFGEQQQDKQRREKLRALTERINRDMVRAEREGLIGRGVYGGSGGSGVVKSTLL
jgi:hypothetical protein